MSCAKCENIPDVSEAGGLYVIRKCAECGRPMKLREPGAHGIGVKIEKGDQVVLPAASLQLAANPLKGTGQFSKTGLGWFANMIFSQGLEKRRHDFLDVIAQLDDEYGDFLKQSPLLEGFNIEDPAQSEALYNKLKAKKARPSGGYTFQGVSSPLQKMQSKSRTLR